MYRRLYIWFITVLFLVLVTSCNASLDKVSKKSSEDIKPLVDKHQVFQKAFAEVASSVYKLNVIAFYDTYVFNENNNLEKKLITDSSIKKFAVKHSITNNSVLGTAIAIYNDGEKAGFLTCSHVVSFPDTIITFFPGPDKRLSGISIKIKQKNYIAGRESGDVNVLFKDAKNDIAFIKMDLSENSIKPVPLNFKSGTITNLKWGDKLFILGYPNGQKMLTHGFASKPKNKKQNFFLADALFNQGISGAPVLKEISEPPYLVWIGMARSASVSDILFLEPLLSNHVKYSNKDIFHGKMVINNKKMINYGITYSVSIDQIRMFVSSHSEILFKNGFSAIIL